MASVLINDENTNPVQSDKVKNFPKKAALLLAIFNDIVTLKNAAAELKKFNIKLRSISIGKPKMSELDKIPLPTDKVYAFFMFETLNGRTEASFKSIIKKYQGMLLENKIILAY